ncbi:MAG: sensor histidine kinase [Burkholderiales bacterium]|nr:sensor histidine kinase [Opitutaceae bacterium]
MELALPEGPAWARAEAASLEQVLDNLLGNACKFSPPGGTVGLTLAAGPEGWRGEVWDEGAGVPEAERARLFGKFHRAGVRATEGEGGSGLGLFIVRTLMTAMGGRVSYAPRTPRGSIFCVEWPRARG